MAVSVVAMYDANMQNQALAEHLATLTKPSQTVWRLQSQLQIYLDQIPDATKVSFLVMSSGFSFGDFVAGAQLAYTLCQALSDSKGSAREYQELMAQLDVVHKVLLQVDQLCAANQLAQATVNALLFTVNSANAAMERFIEQNEAYSESLKPVGSGNLIKDLFRKGKWGTQMSDRVRYGLPYEFRDTTSNFQILGKKSKNFFGYHACSHQLPRLSCLLLQVRKIALSSAPNNKSVYWNTPHKWYRITFFYIAMVIVIIV
jgi:hypothetical protein